ncbi:urease accessory protein UreF [Pollutimonas bauzanensis]|uniref:Urease accessory protein UreF n=1 Tax=Pollutimonas bauzanensis TaxID=658167 RepID=A0A1M5ZMS2_9BURK|nr:urease accessory protein UreF [Pollutimonas bauzanensis]SHI25484.1 urease accessory protein [Pollutimonas bauzanensis]
MDTRQLTALLQLSSPALPIGGYSYSQGFEAAVERGLVDGEASACLWIRQQLELVVAQCEAPIWALLFDGWAGGDWEQLDYWNSWFHASRETQEIRQETEQMGWSLVKLATDLDWGDAGARRYLLGQATVTLPAAHAYAAYALGIARSPGLAAYLFTWLENQVMAAIKTVPLGQMAAQRILNQLRPNISTVCDEAFSRAAQRPPRIHTLAPQFAILSSRHETQYSRLFRS